MKDDNIIVSGFDSRNEAASMAVDFALAKPLDRSGSTCDAYECVVQRRRVFVKRLKAEYRDNPLYRAAFDKEYDLGVSLSHPSLPRYVGFGGDYIVMDFIEGDTLSALIKRDDPRLKSRKFVRRLLSELVDVVEYLHRRNIVHCDIKADNVIVSPYDDRPVTLIDLDKAYTSWLGTTHGNTQKYGCEGCADGAIDFRGIGLIATQLGRGKVALCCAKNEVTAASVRRAIKSEGKGYHLWAVICGLLFCIAVVLWFLHVDRSIDDTTIIETPPTNVVQSETVDNKVEEVVVPTTDITALPIEEFINTPEPHTTDAAWIASLIQSKTAELEAERERIYRLLESDTISAAAANMELMGYLAKTRNIRDDIYESAKEQYPDIQPSDVQLEVHSVDEWAKWTRNDDALFFSIKAYCKAHSTQ